MKNMRFVLSAMLVAMVCMVASCRKDKTDDGKDSGSDAKYLTSAEFAKSTWTGDNDVTLVVSSEEAMTFTYKEKVAVSKNTEDPEETEKTVTVQIQYAFDEAKGTFAGSGDDNKSYSGTLTSKAALTFNQETKSYALTKKSK